MEFDNIQTSVPKKQGNLGVARAIYEYTKLGYTVLVPLSDSDKYDLVIDTGINLVKVQVKTSNCKARSYKYNKTGWAVNLATKGGNTTKNSVKGRQPTDYDLLFVLTADSRCWSIPTVELGTAQHSINVGATGNRAKYTQFEIL
jgi:hypothetical protein